MLGCKGWGACGPFTYYESRNGLGKSSLVKGRDMLWAGDLARVKGIGKEAKPTWMVPFYGRAWGRENREVRGGSARPQQGCADRE